MAFCRFCGKEIPEGNICDECKAAHPEQTVQTEPLTGDSPAAPNPVPTDNLTGGANDNKKNLAVIGAAVVVLIIIIALISSIAGGGYKKPIKNVMKGLSKADSEKMLDAVYPEDYLEDLADEEDEDLDDLYDEIDDELEELIDELEDEYGKNVKFSYDVEDKDKMDEDDIDDLEDYYDDYLDLDVEIKKAYEVSGTLTIEGKDDDDDTDFDLVVVKIKGEGWFVCPFEGDFSSLDIF